MKKKTTEQKAEETAATETVTPEQSTTVLHDENNAGQTEQFTDTPKETQQQQTQINLESSKTTLSKRPWKLGAVQLQGKNDDGTPRQVWVAAVIDADGHPVCCGDTVDMEFILKLENSYDAICSLIKSTGKSLSEAFDVLEDFECKRTKAFKFNAD